MRLVIQQPQFMAWSGYWSKVRTSEKLVLYAGVKFDKSDHIHRVTLDKGLWVGAQVGDVSRNQLIKDVVVNDLTSLWKLSKTLRQRYAKCPYAARLDPLIVLFENWTGKYVLDLNVDVLAILFPLMKATADLVVDTTDRRPLEKIDKLVAAVAEFGPGAEYYMGSAGLDYMGFDSLPGNKVYVQEKRGEVSPHSIVQLVATHEKPWEVVDQSWQWKDREGVRHMVVNGERHEDHSRSGV